MQLSTLELEPIFADIELLHGNINLERLKKKVTKKTKGLIIVHMAGYPCEMKRLDLFVKKKNILLRRLCPCFRNKYKFNM